MTTISSILLALAVAFFVFGIILLINSRNAIKRCLSDLLTPETANPVAYGMWPYENGWRVYATYVKPSGKQVNVTVKKFPARNPKNQDDWAVTRKHAEWLLHKLEEK